MSSHTTPRLPSVSATATALLALTTPFKQQPGCESHFTTTSVISTDVGGTILTTPLVISEIVESCYPSGWDSVVPESRLCFSPAVCPSGWLYYNMAEEEPTLSTAYCCNRSDQTSWYILFKRETNLDPSGYTFLYSEDLVTDIVPTGCGRWIPVETATANKDDPAYMALEQTFVVHEAWVVSWAANETSTLTPSLPTLTNKKLVPTWTPGQVIPDGEYDRNMGPGKKNYVHGPALWFLLVGMPILGAICIGSCIWCCVRSCKKKRRERNAVGTVITENVSVRLDHVQSIESGGRHQKERGALE